MGVERQQGRAYQISLFEGEEETVRHGVPGEGGTGTGAYEEQQRPTASERKRALPEALMEEVVEPRNLNRGYLAGGALPLEGPFYRFRLKSLTGLLGICYNPWQSQQIVEAIFLPIASGR